MGLLGNLLESIFNQQKAGVSIERRTVSADEKITAQDFSYPKIEYNIECKCVVTGKNSETGRKNTYSHKNSVSEEYAIKAAKTKKGETFVEPFSVEIKKEPVTEPASDRQMEYIKSVVNFPPRNLTKTEASAILDQYEEEQNRIKPPKSLVEYVTKKGVCITKYSGYMDVVGITLYQADSDVKLFALAYAIFYRRKKEPDNKALDVFKQFAMDNLDNEKLFKSIEETDRENIITNGRSHCCTFTKEYLSEKGII